MNIVERAQALSMGLRTYFTGRPCKRGHLSERNTIEGSCRECIREVQRELRRDFNARRQSSTAA